MKFLSWTLGDDKPDRRDLINRVKAQGHLISAIRIAMKRLMGGALMGGFIVGVALAFPYSALQRAAMLSTDSPGVGVIRYFLPLMTLVCWARWGLWGRLTWRCLARARL